MLRRRVIGSINISNDATVTCESKTYNGQTQVATNITVTFKGETLTENVDYIITENNGGTNVDSYTVKIKGVKKYSGNRQGSFSIMKVTPTVTVPTPRTSLIYNGNAQALIAAGSTDFGTLKYSLDDSTYSTSIPSGTNATSYTVYYKVEGDSNVNDVPAQSVSVSIGKVTPTVVSPTAKVLTYNGSQQELVNAGSTDFGTLQYKVGSDSWSTSIPTRQRGGSYELSYRVVGDSNVNDVAAESVQCSINEKQVTATVTLSQTAYTYNGSACQPTPTVKDGSTVIDPSEYSVTYSNNINAGTGTVTISDNVGGDYKVIGSATFTINKADPTYTAPTTKTGLVYNANAQALLNSGSATGGTIYYSSDNSTWSTAIPSGTNATSYTSYWKITGDSNHNDKASASISTTIAKAPTCGTAPTAKSLTYNNSGQALVNAGSSLCGTMQYATASTATYSTTIPTQTNAGTYTTYWKVANDSNHSGTSSGSVSTTISKASQPAPTANSATTTYPTTATATASGGGGQGSLEWSNGNTQTSVGSKNTQARWSGNANYNASSWSNQVTITMNKASQNAPTATGATVNYGSTATATASGGGGQGTLTWTNGNTRTAIGSQTTQAYWGGNGNYSASPYSNSVTLTVQPVHNGHEFVEIGGVKWATMNIGANSVSDYGLFFQCGDTSGYTASQVGSGSGKKYFGWADYKYGNGTSEPGATGLTKYNATDGLTVLEASDDAAQAAWGGSWRMPTEEEIAALSGAVNTSWLSNYNRTGIRGLLCTAKDGSGQLFFPAAGRGYLGSVTYVGTYGYYWSGSIKSSYVMDAYYMLFSASGVSWGGSQNRFLGFAVRGVVGE